jgi:hypothetical protein
LGELANIGGLNLGQLVQLLGKRWDKVTNADGYELYVASEEDFGEPDGLLVGPDGRTAEWNPKTKQWQDWTTHKPMPPEWSKGIVPKMTAGQPDIKY